VPGWHKKTEHDRLSGKVRMAGIIQEQHPHRARLFMQWKQMDWPIMIDRLNLLEVLAVPITVLIDKNGIIRALRPTDEQYREFLETDYTEADKPRLPEVSAPDLEQLRQATDKNAQSQRDYAAALMLWGDDSSLGTAIDAFNLAIKFAPEHGPTYFRLGAAFRTRYDSDYRQPDDFNSAIGHWTRALELDPNQYIWRRRIQQYGPRLDKPYSFYDWVNQARQEIVARGESPSPLRVEPGGAEFAYPSKEFDSATGTQPEPDPGGRIFRDEQSLIRTEVTVVPKSMKPGETGRVHVVFRPDSSQKAHWNNEMEDLVFWIATPDGWLVDNHHLTVSRPPEPVSIEPRRLEFEIKCPQNTSGQFVLKAYSLYYVCEDKNGACLYRRQDVPIRIEVKSSQ
jgi:tetratricopeptide (TPR) repeat protein